MARKPRIEFAGAHYHVLNRGDYRGDLFETAKAASKSAPCKIALAVWIKRGSSVSNSWLSEQLHMGPPDAVSRHAGELTRGGRAEARKVFDRLTTKVRG